MTRGDGGRDGFQKRGPPRQGGSSQSYSRGGPGTGGGGREGGGGSGNRGDSRGSYIDSYGGHNDRSRGVGGSGAGSGGGMNRGYNGKAFLSAVQPTNQPNVAASLVVPPKTSYTDYL